MEQPIDNILEVLGSDTELAKTFGQALEVVKHKQLNDLLSECPPTIDVNVIGLRLKRVLNNLPMTYEDWVQGLQDRNVHVVDAIDDIKYYADTQDARIALLVMILRYIEGFIEEMNTASILSESANRALETFNAILTSISPLIEAA